jgi:hypothetical protein
MLLLPIWIFLAIVMLHGYHRVVVDTLAEDYRKLKIRESAVSLACATWRKQYQESRTAVDVNVIAWDRVTIRAQRVVSHVDLRDTEEFHTDLILRHAKDAVEAEILMDAKKFIYFERVSDFHNDGTTIRGWLHVGVRKAMGGV